MNVISIWASQNTKKAIILIIIIEFVKNSIGFDIGHNFLPTFSPAFIELAVLGIVFLITFLQINYKYQAPILSKEVHSQLRLRSTGIIFLSSLFLSILLGNHFKGLGYSINSVFIANAAVTMPADSVQNVTTEVIKEKKHSLKSKLRLFSKKTADGPYGNKRIGYVLLFLLSLVLTYGGLVLSCSVLCSGYGVLSVLTLLVTVGVFSGGIYFLIKAFSNPVKPLSTMTREEKKKERKKFFILWGVLSAAAGILLLISNFSN